MSPIIIKPFADLTLQQLYDIMQLRQEVFVVEQDCPYLDADGKDQFAHHLMWYDKDILIAYTRLIPSGISYDRYTSIGRVVNKSSHRGRGLGYKVMLQSIEWLKLHFPQHDIKISAQCYLDKFYSSLGFVSTGDHYLEDNIPHQAMIYTGQDKN